MLDVKRAVQSCILIPWCASNNLGPRTEDVLTGNRISRHLIQETIRRLTVLIVAPVAVLVCLGAPVAVAWAAAPSAIPFTHAVIDSTPPRNQHAKTTGDINGDGFDDVITAGAITDDGIFWYAYPSWSKHTIFPADSASFATDMQVGDVDRDGDLDIIVPKRNETTVWWYENPRPSGDPASSLWVEHLIGVSKAHDLEVGDIDMDGRLDVVVREDSTKLFLQDPAGGWTGVVISTRPDEGLALGDVDADGDIDAAINGYWLENPLPLDDPATVAWPEYLIDSNWPTQVAVHIRDINGDGRTDVILAPSESENGRLSWYDAPAGATGAWVELVIDNDVSYFHTFKTADMDIDGDLDIVTGEMEQSSDPDEVSIYLNQGDGLLWTHGVVDTTGTHNLRLTDIGLDGDIDIVGANWSGQQVLDLWRNDLDPSLTLSGWQRRVVDPGKPWRSVFITAADLDGDNFEDIVTGGWWYRNPGSADGVWVRDTLGTELRNMAAVFDVDRDGDLDVLGTRGLGSQPNDSLVWARNDGGVFTILSNIDSASGDFLQGATVVPLQNEGRSEVILSWHATGSTVQRLTIPPDPSVDPWTWDEITPLSEIEALSAGDIDRDGDIDVLQGTRWLRNDSTAWSVHTVYATADPPDRNRLADINRDGRLDAVVGYEAISVPGKLAWYEQGPVATDPWIEHVIATIVGPMSVTAVDMDSDGDIDVVVGEHNLVTPASAALFVFENVDGQGNVWSRHTVHIGDEHHDGAQVVDIDHDGDMDILSIGWDHNRVLLYENLALGNGGGLLNDPPVAVISATPIVGGTPLDVSFDASLSFDPDGDSLIYVWDFGDGSPPDSSITVNHNYTQSAVFNATLTVNDGEISTVDGTTITVGVIDGPMAGLVHRWQFDEDNGGVAGDSAGAADGTLVNGASWESSGGRTGSAIRFDGFNDRVDLGSVDVEGGTGITLALWFQVDAFPVPDGRFISKTTGAATDDHYWMLSTIDSTALRFRLKAGGVTDLIVSNPGEIEVGKWHHVAATYDGTTMRLYKDGVELVSAPKSGVVDTDSTVLVAIGDQPAGVTSLPFDGLIDDVRIYDRALTTVEIDSLVVFGLSVGVSGSGSIMRIPQQLNYIVGDSVTVAAVPDTNWSFVGWSGGLSGTENPDTVVMAADTVITANFVQTAFVVSQSVAGMGTLDAAPDSSTYALGDTVILTATPDTKWSFTGWSGGLAGLENPDTIIIASDTTVAANFVQTAFVVTRNPVGQGIIVAVPDTTTYALGDTVIVTAMPDTGWSFGGWSDGLSGVENPDTVIIASDTTVTAMFTEDQYALTRGVTGNGLIVAQPDSSTYLYGDTVVLSALPDVNWSFTGWSGGLGGIETPDTIIMMSDTTVTANFVQTEFVITRNTTGLGSIDADPDSVTYALGDTVQLTAVPNPGWNFDNWSDGLSGIDNPDTIIIASDTTVTAAFSSIPFILSTSVLGNGSLVVTPDSSSYIYGDTVIFEALPDSNWSFTGWSGGLSGAENPDTVIIISDTLVTATFERTTFFLTNNVVGSGSIDAVPDTTAYLLGDTVILTAVPDPGWSFGGWSDGLSGAQNPDTVIVGSDSTVTATFTEDQYVLSTSVLGSGFIVADPDSSTYIYGDTVVLTASPDLNWSFTGWSGGLGGLENPDTVVMLSDTSVTASFMQTGFVLTRNTTGAGSIDAVPDTVTYALGDTVFLTAVSDPGWTFDTWSDGLSGMENPDTVVIGSDTTVTAMFTEDQYVISTVVVGNGSVLLEPDSASYVYGDTVVVSALPDSCWEFSVWSGGLVGMVTPDTIIVASDSSVTATFIPELFVLNTGIVGGGTIIRTPNQLDFQCGDTVYVGAIPDPGWQFGGWSGGVNGIENPDTIVMSSDTTLAATFLPDTFLVTVTTNPIGREVMVDSVTYTAPQQFMLPFGSPHEIAVNSPQEDGDTVYVFSAWSDGDSIIHTIVVPDSNATYTADFSTYFKFPLVDSIADIPNDQGGWVRIYLTRSWFDSINETQFPIATYNVWRRIDAPASVASGGERMSGEAIREISGKELRHPELLSDFTFTRWNDRYVYSEAPSPASGTLPPGTWEIVGSFAAAHLLHYTYASPTLGDSTAASTIYTAFAISAHTTTPAVWFMSPPDSGYSIDNIAPAVPDSFSVVYNTGNGNYVDWAEPVDIDFQYFQVYRSADPDFDPLPGDLVDVTVASEWYDPDYDGWNVYYKTTAVDDAGNESAPASDGTPTTVAEPDLPAELALYQNSPNPFNPTTVIGYDVPAGGLRVTLQIFDVRGQLIRNLVDGHRSPGNKTSVWDGRDTRGNQVSSGIYFYRLEAGGQVFTKKMVLLK